MVSSNDRTRLTGAFLGNILARMGSDDAPAEDAPEEEPRNEEAAEVEVRYSGEVAERRRGRRAPSAIGEPHAFEVVVLNRAQSRRNAARQSVPCQKQLFQERNIG